MTQIINGLAFYISLSGLSNEFASCIVDTQTVLNGVASPNDLEINGQPKVDKLFNWSRWSKYIKKQNELYKKLNITKGIDYLTRLGC